MVNNKLVCKNCSNNLVGNFCSNCGQKANTFRITFRELFHHIPHAVFHIDHGFFYTVKELAYRPGHAIREYLEGKRKYHFNPFLMLLLLGGFCYLYSRFHFETVLASVSFDKLELQNAAIAHKYFAYRSFFFCMVCSIGDYLLFYHKKYTLPEMIVFNSFMFCGVLLIQLLFFPFILLSLKTYAEDWLKIIPIATSFVYLAFARIQFYRAVGNKFLHGKIIFALVLYLVIIIIIGRFLVKPLLGN
jgi:Protein of unknown function (DUF3667)